MPPALIALASGRDAGGAWDAGRETASQPNRHKTGFLSSLNFDIFKNDFVAIWGDPMDNVLTDSEKTFLSSQGLGPEGFDHVAVTRSVRYK